MFYQSLFIVNIHEEDSFVDEFVKVFPSLFDIQVYGCFSSHTQLA